MTKLGPEDLASPALYPLATDAAWERVLLVRLGEGDYRVASFLDERLLKDFGPGDWVTWASLTAVLPLSTRECDFIFHMGHVGSTLVSRLLDCSPRVFGLREPAVLRALATSGLDLGQAALSDRSSALLGLWSRTWRPEQRTLLKATSFTAEIAPMLLRQQLSARAILMFVQPTVYLAGILAGDASREEVLVTAPLRLARLHTRLGREVWRLEDLSQGEIVAMSWACEMLALARVATDFPARGLWLDFETFLERPADGLAACLIHLHGEAVGDVVSAMASSADLSRYSKAPEYAYDATLRWRVLAQANREHHSEIRRGMDWLSAALREHQAVADAFKLANAGSAL